MMHWKHIVVAPTTSILETIKVINDAGLRAALVADEAMQLLGLVTDGDIRRALLKNIALTEPVARIMNTQPTTASMEDHREQILLKLQTLKISHIPIVDANRRLIGFETVDTLLAHPYQDNWVVVMAGGMGERLYPLTANCPKPLLKIGNKPVLEILLENFIKSGFRHFYFSVNYKAEMIKSYFTNGARWGVEIKYIEENKRLGTAGALQLLTTPPDNPFFVINADVLTNIDFKCLLEYHLENQVDATLCIREHEQAIPFGVVERDEQTHHLRSIVEKPVRQFYVSAGIYILEPHLLTLLPHDTYCDMPDLLTTCVQQKQRVTTFPIREYWLDIGRHEDLARAHEDYQKREMV